MAVTTREAIDVSQALATALEGVDGLRVEWGPLDKARPPCAVIGLPTITWNDPAAGFCWGTFDYPIAIVTARSNDVAAMQELSRYVRDVADVLNHADIAGINDIQMLDARPSTTVIGSAELPSYLVRVQVRA